MADSHNDQIARAVADRSDELVSLLESFVRIPSENPPGTSLTDAQTWIVGQLAAHDIPFELHRTARGDTEHAVIIGTVGEGDRFMYLHGHYDVVPAFSPDQFMPRVEDGMIYGRGTSDMKGGLVAMLVAAAVHRDLGGKGQVRLVYVPDEETGGADGAERMVELGLLETSGCAGAIVGECSYPDIWYAARGAFTVRVTVAGRPAHVGLHYEGRSAFEHAHAMIGELLLWRDSVESHKTEFMIEPEEARSSIVLIGGVSGGGTNFNIVPDKFSFTIDRRPNPDEDYDEARRQLLDILEGFRYRFDFSVEVVQDARSAATAADDSFVRSVQSNVANIRGSDVPLSMCPGCLETRVYSQQGIPSVAYGPGPMAVMHGPDEHVPIANLIEACTAYATVLGDILGTDQASFEAESR